MTRINPCLKQQRYQKKIANDSLYWASHIIPQTKNLVKFCLFFLSSGRLFSLSTWFFLLVHCPQSYGDLTFWVNKDIISEEQLWQTKQTRWWIVDFIFANVWFMQFYDKSQIIWHKRWLCLSSDNSLTCVSNDSNSGSISVCNWDSEILYCGLFFRTCFSWAELSSKLHSWWMIIKLCSIEEHVKPLNYTMILNSLCPPFTSDGKIC